MYFFSCCFIRPFFHPKILFGLMGNIVFYALDAKQQQEDEAMQQAIIQEEVMPSKEMAEEIVMEEMEGEEQEDDSKVFH